MSAIISWTARKSNQSILKEINSAYSLEGLTLKLQYLATWCKESEKKGKKKKKTKDPGAGKDRGQEEEGETEDEMVGWHHRLNGHEFEEMVKDRKVWCAAVHGVTQGWTQFSDWTTIIHHYKIALVRKSAHDL